MRYFRREQGFKNQRLYVVPRSILSSAYLSPLERELQLTDAGYYPSAAGHEKTRDRPIEEGVFLFCVRGEGVIDIGGRTSAMHASECCFLPGKTPHRYRSSDHSPWSIYWFHIRGDSVREYAEPVWTRREPVPVTDDGSETVRALFEAILDTMAGGYSRGILFHASRLAAAVMTAVFYANGGFHPDLRRSSSLGLERTAAEMRDRVERGASFSLEEMAACAELSIPHFTVLFRTRFGYTPVEYFTRLKVQKACKILEFTDYPIARVADVAGYADPYYFSRVFRRIMDTSPSMYRKAVR